MNLNHLRIGSLMAIMSLALIFSCADHSIPDPESVANCNRADGSPRFYPCEFEIVKVDFMRGSSNTNVLATLTHENHNVELRRSTAFSFVKTSTTAATAVFKVRVTIKRIAKPNHTTPDGYTLSESLPGGEVDDTSVLIPNRFYPYPLSMAVGETEQVLMRLEYGVEDGGRPLGPNMISIQNPKTYSALVATPHNYLSARDLSEANYAGIVATFVWD